jgi:hypothetical protein
MAATSEQSGGDRAVFFLSTSHGAFALPVTSLRGDNGVSLFFWNIVAVWVGGFGSKS